MKSIIFAVLASKSPTYHIDIIELDSKFDQCRIVFEMNEIESHKTVKCKDLVNKYNEIYEWIQEMKKKSIKMI